MPYADPDFGFLFFNPDWQATRKATKCLPLTAEWQETVRTWIQQATVSEGLRHFEESLRRHGEAHAPDLDADLAQLKSEALDTLNTGSKRSRRDTLATLQFYRQSLAVFPERFLEPVPALYFSEPLVQALRRAPLDLRKELYFTGPTVAYELAPGLFCYATSREYAGEVARHLPAAFTGAKPPDVDLFLSLAQRCSTGEAEMFVIDN